MEQKPGRAQLRPLSEVAYSVQASDWSGIKCRGKEGDGGQLVVASSTNSKGKIRVANEETILIR